MGMCPALCTISDANIQRVLADPPLVWKLVAPDDPEAMMRLEIYPGIWDRSPDAEGNLGCCLDLFHTLQEFVKRAAGHGLGIVVSLT